VVGGGGGEEAERHTLLGKLRVTTTSSYEIRQAVPQSSRKGSDRAGLGGQDRTRQEKTGQDRSAQWKLRGCTSLPSDILGVSIYNQRDQLFEFHEGPVFTNILLADEINRASPRTQSALLEAMGEGQVSVEGQRRWLPDLFFVIATQNPVEFRGTYPLPEAQMDRFALQFTLGYVTPEQEVAILSAQADNHPLERIASCVSTADVLALKAAARHVRISEELKRYIVDLTGATRSATGVQLGASPRASLALMKAAQALALFDGVEFVTPDHIQEIAVPVIAHRLSLESQSKFSGASAAGIVMEALKKVPAPA
jgi:MoxR-like ATPase